MNKIAGSLNLKKKTFTQFFEYDFRDICEIPGMTLLAGDTGLFAVGGKNDNGKAITAWFETLLSSWGSERLKRPRYALISAEADGELKLVAVGGNESTISETMVEAQGEGGDLNISRATFPRTANGRGWKFRFENVDGSFFMIDNLSVFFIMRPYGTSKST